MGAGRGQAMGCRVVTGPSRRWHGCSSVFLCSRPRIPSSMMTSSLSSGRQHNISTAPPRDHCGMLQPFLQSRGENRAPQKAKHPGRSCSPGQSCLPANDSVVTVPPARVHGHRPRLVHHNDPTVLVHNLKPTCCDGWPEHATTPSIHASKRRNPK